MIYLKTFENYLGREEFVEIVNPLNGKSKIVRAKIDTETYTSNIDYELALELGLQPFGKKRVYNIYGDENLSEANVELIFSIGEQRGRHIDTTVTIANRKKLKNQIAIGRKDIESLNMFIDVTKSI
jgi:hypothetical protein